MSNTLQNYVGAGFPLLQQPAQVPNEIEIINFLSGILGIQVHDPVIGSFCATITKAYPVIGSTAIEFNVAKVGNLKHMSEKLNKQENSKKKNQPSEFLKVLYAESIRKKLVAILDKVCEYIPTLNFADYNYLIYEAVDTPSFYVIEKRALRETNKSSILFIYKRTFVAYDCN
jgi:hypothetical protein